MTHPQDQVTQSTIDWIVELIRRCQLDGQDLQDIAVSVDLGEEDYVGPGRKLWAFLRQFEDVSAQYLISEACVCLGWPVAS